MYKPFLISGSLILGLAVVLGAFGAHGLKKIVPPEAVQTFQTGVQYQYYHGFALLLAGILYKDFPHSYLVNAGICFMAGMVLFSGSLYFLTMIHDTASVGLKRVGIITPFGGLLFVAGWLLLAIGIWKSGIR